MKFWGVEKMEIFEKFVYVWDKEFYDIEYWTYFAKSRYFYFRS